MRLNGKRRTFFTCLLALVLAVVTAFSSVAFAMPEKADKNMNGMEFVKQFKAGVNLGNSLTAYNTDDTLGSGDLSNETCWGCPRVTKEQMQTFADCGMDIIRIGVTWGPHMNKDDYKIDPAWMARVKEVVDYALDAGMYVILNTMSEEVFWHVPSPQKYEETKKIQDIVWRQIGEAFADYDEHLLFEAINEPRVYGSYMEWKGGLLSDRMTLNRLNFDFVDTVRSLGGNNAERYLLIPTYAASGSFRPISTMDVPNDDRVIVSIHDYYEYEFCQNTENTEKTEWGTVFEKLKIQLYMYLINHFFVSKGIPVMFTEFGCVDKNNDDERAEWIEYTMKTAAGYGMPMLWWDNGIPHYQYEYGGAFGIMDRETCEITHPKIVDALNCLR